MAATNVTLLECPLCTFSVLPSDDYVLQLHFEQVHTTDSPFRIENDPEPLPPPLPPNPSVERDKHENQDAPSEGEDENSVLCPEPDCGEVVLLSDFNDHLDRHAAETLSFDETTGKYRSHRVTGMHNLTPNNSISSGNMKDPSFLEHNFNTSLPDALRRDDRSSAKLKKKTRARGDSSSSEKSTLTRTILSLNPFAKSNKAIKPPKNSCRLGRAELGPYAWEERMPRWLHDQLAVGPKITVVNRIGRDGRLIKQEQVQNETPGIIPILAQLSALDRGVKEAYYCHPSTLHIGKTPREGGFCGYRNIQMLISYIQGTRAQGFEEFPGRTPGILKLQDLIERAWDKGINEIGRQQTGGIRDTRKYIGTPEAQALFLSTEIDCAVELFTDSPDGQLEAHEQLLYAVENYFSQAAVKDGSNVHKTLLPPIYLQQPGHSLTIVGFERRKDGHCNLMIFDPMYHTSPAMHRLIGRKNIKTSRPEVIFSYRRTARQLKRHAAFEALMLTAHPPLFPAWDVLRQFPDCRYLYAFFRSRTLGYDVYPEDHFLRNFPWQEYGGLWIVDEARFARSGKMNPLTAQALRRITSEGSASPLSSKPESGTYSWSGSSFSQSSPHLFGMRSGGTSRHVSFMTSLEASLSGVPVSMDPDTMRPVLDRVGMSSVLPITAPPPRVQPSLTLQIPMQCKFQGYPGPLSPTSEAKLWYPSPVSEPGDRLTTPRPGSPMSIDGSDMCGPPHRRASHGYGTCFDNTTKDNVRNSHFNIPTNTLPISPPPSQSNASSLSPVSPTRSMSPRTAMLKNMFGKQALQSLSHQPNYGAPRDQSPPSIQIANGTETETVSPLSPSGTMLSYTSNRGVDSGLLAVRPLTEAQVAEYRFWRPCGRRSCVFGCGGANEGEMAAARRLFKDEEVVQEEADRDEEEEEEEEEAMLADGEKEWDEVMRGQCRQTTC